MLRQDGARVRGAGEPPPTGLFSWCWREGFNPKSAIQNPKWNAPSMR
ncbi:hypothetical protein [Candidatus Chlorohelix sp.]